MLSNTPSVHGPTGDRLEESVKPSASQQSRRAPPPAVSAQLQDLISRPTKTGAASDASGPHVPAKPGEVRKIDVKALAQALLSKHVDNFSKALRSGNTVGFFSEPREIAKLGNSLNQVAESIALINSVNSITGAAKGDFNKDVSTVGDSCRSVVIALTSLVNMREQLHPMIDETRSTRRDEFDSHVLAPSLDKLNSSLSKAISAFDIVFASFDKHLPALSATSTSDLEKKWKSTLEMAVNNHLSHVMTAQIFINDIEMHEVMGDLYETKLRLGAVFSHMPQRAEQNDNVEAGAARVVDLPTGGKIELEKTLADVDRVADKYDRFAERMETAADWADSLSGKRGIEMWRVFTMRSNAAMMSASAGYQALGVCDIARSIAEGHCFNSEKYGDASFSEFKSASKNMTERIVALHQNFLHCMEHFPTDWNFWGRPLDRLRRPILQLIAEQCDEIENDLNWMRARVELGETKPANAHEVQRVFDRLQAAVSLISRNLQWNIAISEQAKSWQSSSGTAFLARIQVLPLPSDEEVSKYAVEHLVGVAPPVQRDATTFDIGLDDVRTQRPTTAAVGATKSATRRQKEVAKAKRKATVVKQAAAGNESERALTNARKTLTEICEAGLDIEPLRVRSAALEKLALARADAVGLHVWSGVAVMRGFLEAAEVLENGLQAARGQLEKINGHIATIGDLNENSLAPAEKLAHLAKRTLTEQIDDLSVKIKELRSTGDVQLVRRNVLLFAQRPTRERFLWLLSHAPQSVVSVLKTQQREKLSDVTRDGRHRSGGYLDEYEIELKEMQVIAYSEPNAGGASEERTASVKKVLLHVHYPTNEGGRPVACHFKIAPQSKSGDADAYRSRDSAALMDGVLREVEKMANGSRGFLGQRGR
jgi:hypothetical protein